MSPAPDIDASPSTWPARIAAGASIAVHVGAVAFFLGYAGAGAYESVPEAVPVSIITPEQVEASASEEPPPQTPAAPEQDLSDLRSSLSTVTLPTPQFQTPPQPTPSAASKPQAAPPPQSTQSRTQPAPKQQVAAAAPPPPQQPAPPPSTPAPPAYTTPAPDISMRYGVDLGLKELPNAATQVAEAPRDGKSDFDEAATRKAEIDKSNIAAFRAQLKQCVALPAQIDPSDKVVIVLRASFTPEAKLAAPPTLIEASASAKGPALMQAAIGALQKCQPYASLPRDKYAEWRVLDLRFTPQDFRGG